jgi:hypothetical protein
MGEKKKKLFTCVYLCFPLLDSFYNLMNVASSCLGEYCLIGQPKIHMALFNCDDN